MKLKQTKLLCLPLLLISFASCNSYSDFIEERTIELFSDQTLKATSLKVSFINKEYDIPFFNMMDLPYVYKLVNEIDTVVDLDSQNETVTLKRNNETVTFDLKNDTIDISNFNKLGATNNTKSDADIITLAKELTSSDQNCLAKDTDMSKYEFRGNSFID